MVRKFRTLKQQILLSRLLFNTDPAAGGGGGGNPAPQPVDPTAAFQRLMDKNNNDALKLAQHLFDDNWQQREQLRQLRAQMPEGSVVLAGDDAKTWTAFKALNVPVKDVKEGLAKLPELEKKAKELASMEHYRELSDIGLDGKKLKVSVLQDQLGTKYPDATFRFATEKDKDGKTDVRKAYIKTAADGQEVDFATFAAQNLTDYLPSLKVDAGAQQPAPTGAGPDPAPDGASTSFYDGIRKNVEEQNKAGETTVNPLARFGRETVASQG